MPTTTTNLLPPKPTVQLLGNDGNAFAIIGQCQRAWRKAGLDSSQWKLIMADMMSGSYDHLLQVAMAHFNIE
jgi:phosphodiesterase/alkaline phosphatase D-like protein